ncbi:MAG: ribonuclease Z [Thermodesulfobacteriota bacterium]
MASTFAPRLVNGPFGDPGLLVELRWQGSAVLFDLGRNDGLPAAELLKVTHVFVSHTHMDHFIGFDRVLRLFLNRDKRLYLYGPEGIADCVRGKLSGYVWNLTESYPFVFDVTEVTATSTSRSVFRACTGFRREEAEPLPAQASSPSSATPVLVDEGHFRVRAAITDHRIPCLAFAIDEPTHLNVDGERLARAGFAPGRWLAELKDALRAGLPDDTRLAVLRTDRTQAELPLGELRGLVRVTPGQKLGYIVDTRFLPENLAVLLPVMHNADVLFCESPFLDEDRDQAAMRYHLTAAEAGTIGRLARARRLKVFHYSPRYQGRGDLLRQEAEAAFRGRLDPGVLAELGAAVA